MRHGPDRRFVSAAAGRYRLYEPGPCAHVAGLLATTYTSRQMTYGLRRLRRHALIQRLEHSNTYMLTTDDVKVALFYTKLSDRRSSPVSRRPPT